MPFGGLLTAGIIGGGSSILGGIFGGKGAKKAAQIQSDAAGQIAQQAKDAAGVAQGDVNTATATANTGLQAGSDTGNAGLAGSLQSQLGALAPYIQSGQISLDQLQTLLGPNGPLSGTNNQFKFSPQDWQNDPGYDYLVQQQNQALQRSQAATGGLLTGGATRETARLTNSLASTQLDSAFNRALSTYNTNRQNVLSRISGLQQVSGMGLQSTGLANQDIGNEGQLVNSNIQNTAARIAGNTTQAGVYAGQTGLQAAQIAAQARASGAAAQGAGVIGQANAWNGALGGIANAANTVVYGLPKVTGNTFTPTTGPNLPGYSYGGNPTGAP